MRHDRYADSVETRVLIFFQFLELAVRKISGVRIERGQHALNGSLSGFLVVDVAGVVGSDGGDGFVVIAFDLIGDAIRLVCSERGQTAEPASTADGTAEDRRHQDDDGSSDRKLAAECSARVVLYLPCNFHARNIAPVIAD